MVSGRTAIALHRKVRVWRPIGLRLPKKSLAGVKIALAAARFHSVGVARAGPWNTVEKVVVAQICGPKQIQNT
jgi:hypothetical protein